MTKNKIKKRNKKKEISPASRLIKENSKKYENLNRVFESVIEHQEVREGWLDRVKGYVGSPNETKPLDYEDDKRTFFTKKWITNLVTNIRSQINGGIIEAPPKNEGGTTPADTRPEGKKIYQYIYRTYLPNYMGPNREIPPKYRGPIWQLAKDIDANWWDNSKSTEAVTKLANLFYSLASVGGGSELNKPPESPAASDSWDPATSILTVVPSGNKYRRVGTKWEQLDRTGAPLTPAKVYTSGSPEGKELNKKFNAVRTSGL